MPRLPCPTIAVSTVVARKDRTVIDTRVSTPPSAPIDERSQVIPTVRLEDGRSGFIRPETGTPIVLCDGSWDCPRKRRGKTALDRDHLIDFADLGHE